MANADFFSDEVEEYVSKKKSVNPVVDDADVLEVEFLDVDVDVDENVFKKKIIVFDLETQKSADEVGGWSNAKDMLMSIGSIYIESEGVFKSFTEDQVQELIDELFSADLVVGFNVIGFDYQVLSHYTDKDFSTVPTIDMARDFTASVGHRIKLDYLAQGSLKDVKKSADGLAALRWFKEGEIEKIRMYCEDDVDVTRQIYKYGEVNKSIKYLDGRTGVAKEVKIEWKVRCEK